MPTFVVTGVAGFIGSQLAETLIEGGHEVRGVDCFTPYYDRGVKQANLERLRASERFTMHEIDQTPFPLYGDGSQIRDFTYVGDVVRANLLAADADVEPGTVVNICAGGSTVMRDLIEAVGEAVGSPVPVDRQPQQMGDVHRTGGSHDLATSMLGWTPGTTLTEGIRAQVDWQRSR